MSTSEQTHTDPPHDIFGLTTSEQILDTDPRVRFEREKRRRFEISAARRKKIRDEMVAMERLVYMGLAIASFVMLAVIAFK